MTGRQGDRLKVHLTGGGPWGFRLQGGAGTGHPLSVSKIRRKSKAHNNLYEADVILSVNGKKCDRLNYDQVMSIVDECGMDLVIEILRNANKENVVPVVSNPTQVTEKVIKEEVTTKQILKKITDEAEGFRIKSVSLRPEDTLFQNATSVVKDRTIFPTEPPSKSASSLNEANASDKSVSTEVTADDRKFEKTTTETIHEKHGNVETKIFKKEHEEVIKDPPTSSSLLLNGHISDIPFDSDNRFCIPTESSSTVNSTSHHSIHKKFESETNETKSWHSDDVPITATFNDFTSGLDEIGKSIFSSPSFKSSLLTGQDSDTLNSFRSENFESTIFQESSNPRKKKMYSSSSFYEEPYAIYPTVEEQVELCRKIADSLSDDTNVKSRGANMFYRRVKKSSKWVHEGPEPSDESLPATPEVPVDETVETPTPTPPVAPFIQSDHGPPKLKLLLDPRHLQDATSLRSAGQVISEHNIVSPDICLDLIKDLQSPIGKGAALFAKRKKKSEEWVIDEEKVKSHMKPFEPMPEPAVPTLSKIQEKIEQSRLKLIKSPWEAALESPIGSCDAAFFEVTSNHLAESIIRAAENKRASSLPSSPTNDLSQNVFSPTPSPVISGGQYGLCRANVPRGWTGSTPGSSPSPNVMNYSSDSADSMSTYKAATLPRKMCFHNFNATPRSWKSSSSNGNFRHVTSMKHQ